MYNSVTCVYCISAYSLKYSSSRTQPGLFSLFHTGDSQTQRAAHNGANYREPWLSLIWASPGAAWGSAPQGVAASSRGNHKIQEMEFTLVLSPASRN